MLFIFCFHGNCMALEMFPQSDTAEERARQFPAKALQDRDATAGT
jgi:hypothetical protein